MGSCLGHRHVQSCSAFVETLCIYVLPSSFSIPFSIVDFVHVSTGCNKVMTEACSRLPQAGASICCRRGEGFCAHDGRMFLNGFHGQSRRTFTSGCAAEHQKRYRRDSYVVFSNNESPFKRIKQMDLWHRTFTQTHSSLQFALIEHGIRGFHKSIGQTFRHVRTSRSSLLSTVRSCDSI